MSDDKKPEDWHDTLPFPRRWIVYAAIKLVVLALVVWLALKWQGVL
ncbi:MAG: hypothetical protein KDJ55_14140 [Rhodobiaceae bacterium]|nr:hypothetical protein [Rhodobiaceae bacterium]MCC0060286.1 hypothetical protein [Rhodobiaceae bacterium]